VETGGVTAKAVVAQVVAAPEQEWLAHAERCYEAGKKVFQNANIWQTNMLSNDPKVIATLVLIRTLSNFKGMVTLAQSQMVVEARILTRCCFENLFTVVMLQQEGSKFVEQMVNDREAARKAQGERLLKYAVGDDPELRAYLRGLRKSKAKLLNPKNVAAGPLEHGYAYYAQLSADAGHPGLDALERYMKKTGHILQVNIEPVADNAEIRDTVGHACTAMIGVSVHVNTMLDGPDDPELTALIREMGKRAIPNDSTTAKRECVPVSLMKADQQVYSMS
jgi:hypothetical protein